MLINVPSKFFCGLFFVITSVFAVEPLEIIFEERPPYVKKDGDSIKGILGLPLTESLKKSNISYTIYEKPSKRHLHEIKANRKTLCAVGWFKNPEREKFAQYTKPLYQDKPMGIVTRKNHKTITNNMSIDELLSNKSLIILSKQSYSYGKFVDEKIEKYANKKRDVSSGNSTMLMLVAKKRADFMFISYEEANHLLQTHPNKDELVYLKLKGMPEGNKRYLICSFKVEKNIIESINKNLQ